jgi:hypothetical protein
MPRYDQEEFGGAHEAHNPFSAAADEDALFAKRAAEMQQRMKRRDGSVMSLAASKRASELEKSLNAWEENRLLTSGVVRLKEVRKGGDGGWVLLALGFGCCWLGFREAGCEREDIKSGATPAFKQATNNQPLHCSARPGL